MRVIWEGDAFIWSSLALVNREAVRHLATRADLEMAIATRLLTEDPAQIPEMNQLLPYLQPLSGPADVHIRHQWPFRPPAPEAGRWVVMQPWEYGSIPIDWVKPMREQIDEVWVYSQFLRQVFVNDGIPADKITVIPPGVDTDLFTDHGDLYPLETDKRFVFLFVGGTIPRKGVDLLIKAYVRAFTPSDDVVLVFKDFGSNTFYQGQTALDLLHELAGNEDLPAIQVISDDLAPQQLASLYRRADCLVHPYRGEGFGLPIAEAMATAKPVIVPQYGPCLDFCDATNAYLVPGKTARLAPDGLGTIKTVKPSWWFEVDIDALAETMREVYGDYETALARGRRAQARIREEFTWERMAARIHERLEVIATRPARRLLHQPSPLGIDGLRRFNFLLIPDWTATEPQWPEVFQAYLRAFDPGDDTALILYVPADEASVEAVETHVLDAIAAAGREPEAIPDVVIVQTPLSDRTDLIAAAQGYLPCGEANETTHRQIATLYGRPIVETPTPAILRSLLQATEGAASDGIGFQQVTE